MQQPFGDIETSEPLCRVVRCWLVILVIALVELEGGKTKRFYAYLCRMRMMHKAKQKGWGYGSGGSGSNDGAMGGYRLTSSPPCQCRSSSRKTTG